MVRLYVSSLSCRRKVLEALVSAGTSHTRCAGAVAAEAFTSRRAAARLVPTLPREFAAVSGFLPG